MREPHKKGVAHHLGSESCAPTLDGSVERSKKAKSRNVDMHVCRESDGLIVPAKRANKANAYGLVAESAEGRRPATSNQLAVERSPNKNFLAR
jgi:hypothetical protein